MRAYEFPDRPPEGAVDVLDAGKIFFVERQAPRRRQVCDDRLEVGLESGFVQRRREERAVHEDARARGLNRIRRRLAAEESHDERFAAGAHFEERLIEKMQMQVAAADVDDERHARPHGRDVTEILLGSDAQINAARFGEFRQRGRSRRDRRFVGEQVVGRTGVRSEVAVGFGQLLRERPELAIGQRRRYRVALLLRFTEAKSITLPRDSTA